MSIKVKRLRVITCVLTVLLITNFVIIDAAFAADNQADSNNEMIFEINKDNKNTIYYFVEDDNGGIKVIEENKVASIAAAVGTLTVNSWIGNNVNFTIKVKSGSALLKHTGTVSFLKVASLGLPGSVFNSQTFKASSPIGVHTLYKQLTMNACGKTQIYIKLTNLKVYDTYGDVLSMNSIGPQKYIKSYFS